ncbi:DUF1302 domain-containing protein [Solimonas marina]|uniref:DUF1302 domain-containing protein n=1 Tax=Solimonas marina TaxID=2714601 RepID=A0A970B644_9GAMM|nr:DUF1302 domain-containing protein [Solimonas marina]NKF24067.1 DUF1302 domain-containing protein [Solimonas marina]
MKKNLIASAVALVFATPVMAYTDTVSGVDLQLNSRITLGGAWRLESRDPKLIGISKGGNAYSNNDDDGNLAFGKGDLVSSAAKITSDLTLTKGDFGLFVRGSYLFNEKLNNKKDFFNADNFYTPGAVDPGYGVAPSGNVSVASTAELRKKTRAVQDYTGNDADLLDAYVFGSLPIGSHTLAFKLGRQVLNWGESTFVLNGINSILAFDSNQLHVPGYALDEVVIPESMAWLSFDISPDVSVEAFYQFDAPRTQPDAAGTFWSTNDFAAVGGTRADISFGLAPENTPNETLPRTGDVKPDKTGQFGGKISFLIPSLNDMDLSFYAMTYSSRLPLVSGTSKSSYAAPSETGTFFLEYPGNIGLYGVSFNTTLGAWALQGEYSLKTKQPLQVDDVELLLAGSGAPSQVTPPPAAPVGSALGNKYIRGYRRHDVSQVDLSVTRLAGPMRWIGSDQMLFLAEAGGVYVHDLPPQSELRFEGPGTYTPGDATVAALVSSEFGTTIPQNHGGYATPFSWGYKLLARFTYNNVFGKFRLEPQLRFDHDVQGVTPTPLLNFVEHRKTFNASVTGYYLQAWSAEIGYTAYFGGGRGNLLADRDFAEAVLRYQF